MQTFDEIISSFLEFVLVVCMLQSVHRYRHEFLVVSAPSNTGSELLSAQTYPVSRKATDTFSPEPFLRATYLFEA
jgi:hypothetical protein